MKRRTMQAQTQTIMDQVTKDVILKTHKKNLLRRNKLGNEKETEYYIIL